MQVFFSITFMGMGAGQAAALAPDIGKARPAMKNIFEVLHVSLHVYMYARVHVLCINKTFVPWRVPSLYAYFPTCIYAYAYFLTSMYAYAYCFTRMYAYAYFLTSMYAYAYFPTCIHARVLVQCVLVQCVLVPCVLVPCMLVPCVLVPCMLVQCISKVFVARRILPRNVC
jgi:hypothetical protein